MAELMTAASRLVWRRGEDPPPPETFDDYLRAGGYAPEAWSCSPDELISARDRERAARGAVARPGRPARMWQGGGGG